MSERLNKGGHPLAIDDASLVENRDACMQLLAERWGDVGWDLERAKTPEALRAVFRTLADEYQPSVLLTPFLVDTSEDGRERRQTRLALDDTVTRIYALTPRVLRDAERTRESRTVRKRGSPLTARVVRQEHARLRSQRESQRELRRLERERAHLQVRLHQQDADCAQSELLAFIGTKRYRITPRNVAYAMAGLPQIGWWHSYRRCQALAESHPPLDSLHGRMFELIARSWKRQMTKARFVDALRTNIKGLRARDCGQIAFRAHMADHWRYLRLAVEESQLGRPDTPHRVFRAFRRWCGLESAEERVLAARERLPFAPTDPDECIRIHRTKR